MHPREAARDQGSKDLPRRPPRTTSIFDSGQQGYANWWFPAVGLVFVAYVTAMGSWRAGHRLDQGLYEIVEGPVTDYANNGRGAESFSVNGHRFSYSDHILTSGFHTTAADGGPIREGLYVRIVNANGLIPRLKVGKWSVWDRKTS